MQCRISPLKLVFSPPFSTLIHIRTTTQLYTTRNYSQTLGGPENSYFPRSNPASPFGAPEPQGLGHGYNIGRWSDLSFGERIVRAGRKSRDGIVFIIGLGLFVVVGYATLTELLAHNSPTKLFNDAADRVKANSEIRAILPHPLKFLAPQSAVSRRRNHRVASNVTKDPSTGKETLILHFLVEATTTPTTMPTSEGWFFVRWYHRFISLIPPLPFTAREFARGEDITLPSPPPPIPEEPKLSWYEWWKSIFVELLRGFIPLVGVTKAERKGHRPLDVARRKPALGEYMTGECVAQFEQNENGDYKYKSLWVDVPNSQTSVYRVDILSQSKMARISQNQDGETGLGRLAFWTRKTGDRYLP